MPRWTSDYVRSTRKVCPKCGGKKEFNALACRACASWAKPLAGRTGTEHPAWKGGTRVDKDGYIKTYAPDHPWPRKGGYVFEHVRVIELHLGRRLVRPEVVHHKNHTRTDNRLENLEVTTAGEHSKHHRRLDVHRRTRNGRGQFAGKEVAGG